MFGISGVATSLLNNFLGDYVVLEDQLSVGLTSGKVDLQNLRFKPEALLDLNLPITVTAGSIGHLHVELPYRDLWGKPTKVVIEDVFILAAPKKNLFDDQYERRLQITKQRFLDFHEMTKSSPVEEEEDDDEESSKKAAEAAKNPAESWVDYFVTPILRNLQVTIKNIHVRYEDDQSNPGRTFAVGLTLDSLVAQSCDENWVQMIVKNATDKVVRKLCQMRNLSVYWNSDSEKLSYKSPKEFAEQMRNLTFQDDQPAHPSHQFMLAPLCGELRATLDLGKVPDFSKPKIHLHSVFDVVKIGIHEQQYEDLIRMSDGMARESRGTAYRQLRPQGPPPTPVCQEAQPLKNGGSCKCKHHGTGLKWFRYAVNAVLQDVRKPRQVWSWKFLRNACKDRREYIAIWYAKKAGHELDEMQKERLAALEFRLNYQVIVEHRKIAEALWVRQEKKAELIEKETHSKEGWLGSVWSHAKGEKQKVLDEELDLSPELLVGIAREITSAESASEKKLTLPPTYVKMSLDFALTKGAIMLNNYVIGESPAPLMDMNFDALTVKMQQRETSSSIAVGIASLELLEYHTLPGQARLMVKPSDGDEDLLQLTLDMNPLDGHADTAVKLLTRPLDIVFSMPFVDRVVSFFQSATGSVLDELIESAQDTAASLQQKAAMQLKYSLEEESKLDLNIVVQAPNVVVPFDFTSDDCPRLVLVMGHLFFNSDLDAKSNALVIKDGKKHVSEDYFYQKFTIGVRKTQLMLVRSADWRKYVDEVKLCHIVEDLSLSMDLRVLSFPTNALPAIKLKGKLTSPLNGNIGGEKLSSVLAIIDSMFPPPTPEQLAAINEKRERMKKEEARRERNKKLREAEAAAEGKQIDEEAAGSFMRLIPSATGKEKDELRDSNSEFVMAEGLLDVGDNPASLALNFEINEVSLLIYHRDVLDDRAPHKEVVLLKLEMFEVDFTQRLNDMEVVLQLGGMGVVDKIQTFGDEFSWLIDGIYDENGPTVDPGAETSALISLKYRGLPKKSPLYEQTDHVIECAIGAININVNRATVLYLLDFINLTVSGLAPAVEESAPVVELLEDDDSSESEVPASPKRILDQSNLALIKVSLGTLNLALSKEHASIAGKGVRFMAVTVAGGTANVSLRNNGTMLVDASLGSLNAINESAESDLWRRIAHTQDGDERVIEVKFQTFLPNVINYPGYDTYFKLKMSSLSAIFKNVFVEELTQYFAQMDEMKQYISSQVDEAATAAVEKSGKMLLDVSINNPYIIVPVASDDESMMVVDLGVITVFTQYEGQGAKEMQKMSITIQQLNLSTGKKSARDEQQAFLSKTDVVVFIALPVDAAAHVIPDVAIHGTMTEMGISFNEDQLGVIFSILGGNLNEHYVDPAVNAYVRATVNEVEAGDVHEAGQGDESYPMPLADKRAAEEEEEVWKTLALNFSFQQFSLTLNRVVEGPLASFEINNLSTVVVIRSDSSQEINVEISELVFSDLRPEAGDASGFRRILAPVRTSKDINSKLIKLAMTTSATGFMSIRVDIENFRINLILECIWAIVGPEEGFLMVQLAKMNQIQESTAAPVQEETRVELVEDQESALHQEEEQQHEEQTLTIGRHRKEELRGGMHIQVKIRRPEIALIEKPLEESSRALVIGGSIAVEYLVTADGAPSVHLELRQFTVVKTHSGTDVEVKLVPPWNVTFSYMVVPNETTSIEVTLARLKTVLSYRDFRLFFRMYLHAMKVMQTKEAAIAEAAETAETESEASTLKFESTASVADLQRNYRGSAQCICAEFDESLVLTVHHKENPEDLEISVTLEKEDPAKTMKQMFIVREGLISLASEPGWALAIRGDPVEGAKLVLFDLVLARDEEIRWDLHTGIALKKAPGLFLTPSRDVHTSPGDSVVLGTKPFKWIVGAVMQEEEKEEAAVAVATTREVETLSLSLEGIQIQMIDDAFGSIDRILKIDLGATDLILSGWSSSMRGILTSSLLVNYFNMRAQAWEPLLRGLEAPSKELRYAAVVAHEREWYFQLQMRQVKEALKLTIGGEFAMSLTLSRAMIDTVNNLLGTWTFADMHDDAEAIEAADTPDVVEVAPYKIQNMTGRVIEWQVAGYAHRSLSPDQGRNEVTWSPDAGSDSEEIGGHHITLRVAGISSPLTRLNMERLGRLAFNLNGPVLVYEVTYDKGTRNIALRSNIQLVNECHHRITVTVDTGSNQRELMSELGFEQKASVPLHFLQHKLHLETNREDVLAHGYDIQVAVSRAIELTKLALVSTEGAKGRRTASALLDCAGTGGTGLGFAFALKVEGQPDRLSANAISWTITIDAPLRMRNMLPVDIEYRIIDMHEKNVRMKHQVVFATGTVESSGITEIHITKPKTQFGIAIRAVGGPWCFPVAISGTGMMASKLEMLIDPTNAENLVDVKIDRLIEGEAHQVTLYVPFMLLNRTGLSALWKSDDFQRKKNQSVGGQSIEQHQEWLLARQGTPFYAWFEKLDPKAELLFYSGVKLSFKVADSVSSDTLQLANSSFEGVMSLKSEKKSKESTEPVRSYEISVKTFSAPGAFWRSKVVQLTNRYVLVNRTGMSLEFCQVGTDDIYKLDHGQQVPFHWRDAALPELLHARLSEGGSWGWTGPFDIQPVALFEVKAHNSDTEQRVYMTVQTTTEGTTTAVILRPSDADCALYMISNKTPFPIRMTQHQVEDDDGELVLPNAMRNFVWAHPSLPNKQLILGVPEGKVIPTGIFASTVEGKLTYPFDSVEKYKPVSVETASGTFMCLPQVYFKGMTKVFELRWNNQKDVPVVIERLNVVYQSIEVKLAGIGLAIITDEPKEFIHIYMEDVRFSYEDGDRETTMEADIKRLQIDSMVYNAVYPIMWWPKNAPDREFLHFAMNQAKGYEGVTFLNLLNFSMQEADVMVDEALITNAVKVMDVLFKASEVVGPLNENVAQDVRDYTSTEMNVSDMVYCRWLEIGSVKLNLSYSTCPWAAVSLEGEELEKLLAWICHMTELDAAPIMLNGLILENPFRSMADLNNAITSHYMTQLIAGFYLLLGSLPILGSPVQLVGSLGTGFKDFFVEPAKGITRSPKEFGEGLRKGTTSLVKGTVGGLTNTVSKLTSAVGNAIAMFTFDKEYQRTRDRSNKKQAKHAGEGLLYGVQDFGRGIFQGLVGVVVNPIQGAKDGGALGFVTGLAKGVTGIVTKPLAGTFDMTSRLAQGIRNTTTYAEMSKRKRIRRPRYFGQFLVVEDFNGLLAEGQEILYSIRDSMHMAEYYVFHFPYLGAQSVVHRSEVAEKCRVLVSNKNIFYLKGTEIYSIDITWRIALANVTRIVRTPISVILLQTGKRDIVREIPLKSESAINYVYFSLSQAVAGTSAVEHRAVLNQESELNLLEQRRGRGNALMM